MKKIKIYLLVVLILAIIAPNFVTASNDNGKINSYLDLIIEKSNKNIDTSNLLEDMIMGAFENTDKYSYFQKTETYVSEQNQYVNAEYEGIGISMTPHQMGVKIVSVFDYSSASFAGLETDDIIVSVNGENIANKSLSYIASIVKGPVNTYVRVGVLKNNEEKILYYDLSRQVVAMKTVKSYIMNGIGYVYISSFTNETGNEFAEALEKFAKKDITKIILDLRNNGGGTVIGSIQVARHLLSDSVITKMSFKYPGYLDLRYVSSVKDVNYDITLLVNGGTASASEIVTGALKDNEECIIIGEKTYGKSVVQSSYKILTDEAYNKYSKMYDTYDMYLLNRQLAFNNEEINESEYIGAAKITIGEYLTPKGDSINLIGIKPDIEVIYDGTLFINMNNLNGMLWIRKKYDIGMSSYEVYKAKVVLKTLGYNVGSMNVLYDEIFKSAIKQFQDDCGLYPYGVLDYTTQDNINNILRMQYIKNDEQLDKAFEVIEGEAK